VISSLVVDSLAVDTAHQNATKIVNESSLASKALLHELQLGEQLNESLNQTRRADFALMLAMLAPDVREQSQFILPPASTTKSPSQDNATLRAFFKLPDKAPLAIKNNEQINLYNQAEMLNEKGLENLHLSNAMIPRPLAFRDDVKHIQSNVMTNTSLHCQLRHSQLKHSQLEHSQMMHDEDEQELKLTDQVLNKPLSFNAKQWLQGIEQALVKAPLLA